MLDVWTTQSFADSQRFDAWREALDGTYLQWALDPPSADHFNARVRQRMLDGVRVTDCYCDPCTGWRRRPQLKQSDDAYFGILFELGGREIIRQGDDEAQIEVGDFVMWDSEREMEFRVLKPLTKLTLMIPKTRMRMFLGDAERYAGTVIQKSAGTSGIAAEALRRLAFELPYLNEKDGHAAIDPVLSVLTATLRTRHHEETPSRGRRDSFRQFIRDIETELCNPNLTPQLVADRRGVSLRYLHSVFAEHHVSFGQTVREQRLARSYRDLLQSQGGETITAIAFRWGFSDAAHFSRAFKTKYGLPPRELLSNSRGERPNRLGRLISWEWPAQFFPQEPAAAR